MNTPGINYITASQYWNLIKNDHEKDSCHSLKDVQESAKGPIGKCEVCGADEWLLAGVGLCFTCTTGESDASDDYELISNSK